MSGKKKKKPSQRKAASTESSPSSAAKLGQANTKATTKSSSRLVLLVLSLVVIAGLTLWIRSTLQSGGTAVAAQDPIFYLGPDEYYMNRGYYIQDAQGQTVKDTVLLPALPEPLPPEPDSHGGYIGPDACAKCHTEKHDGWVHTSHARTSAVPTQSTVLGKFSPGENVLQTESPNLRIEMLEENDELVQRLILEAHGESLGGDFPFDIVTGSGKIGQTYLYFQGEHLYQLHASYLTSTDSWMNSPGYLDGVADFARPVLSACLECHSTYMQPYEGSANQYHRENTILGITCEKCHGPGEEHVKFHEANPDAKEAEAIVNPATMSAERSLELCQLCHGGDPIETKQPPFSFRPGEPLSDFYEYAQADGNAAVSGIHTNTQLPRLKRSKCFEMSESMTCLDCHNPHQFERGNDRLFSERCLNCHEMPDCGKFEQLGDKLADNCIDCHMLNLDMNDIKLISGDERFVPKMRDHYITVWPEATEEFLKQMQEKLNQ